MQRWSARTPFLPETTESSLALGLGLIGIGKPWGFANSQVPEDEQVGELLTSAVALGIRFFDTAPSYGDSEARFGSFLRVLEPATRNSLTVATKFGEHWNAKQSAPFVDHTYDALTRSLDGSLERLERIDFLQLHKTTPEALRSKEVERAFAYAASQGIRNVGASVSDLVSAEIALSTEMFSVLQFPLNPESMQYREFAARAEQKGVLVLTNRPFGMGRLLYGEQRTTPENAFRFLKQQRYRGVVLTGTKSAEHLRENVAAFRSANDLV